MYCEIAIPVPIKNLYIYSVPESLKNKIEIGKRVWVNFRNRKIIGVIVKIYKELNSNFDTKDIIDIIDEKPLLTLENIKLAEWIRDYYITSLGEALKLMFPNTIKYKKVTLPDIDNLSEKNISLTPLQQKVYNSIVEMKLPQNIFLYGITGSGKTEIYFKLMEYYVKKKVRLYI